MDGSRGYNAKWNVREKPIPYDFTHMWNLKNKINEHRKKRDKPRNRLLTIESKLMVTRGELGGEDGWNR